MKVVHAPFNIAMQPLLLVDALKKRGVDAHHLQYLADGKSNAYENFDKIVNFKELGGKIPAQFNTLKKYLEQHIDIFHFWKTSFVNSSNENFYSGIDLPLLKSRGSKIVYHFNGYEIRPSTLDLQYNPYSVFRYGIEPLKSETSEHTLQLYLDFLREYVDLFIVPDPELRQFLPEAIIVPRWVDLKCWSFQGIKKNSHPQVVHVSDSNGEKGTKFILQAVESLKEEGLKFEFKLLQNISPEEWKHQFQEIDIVVNGLLTGTLDNFSLRAMALGKVLIANIREDLFKPFYNEEELPLINANPDNIKLKLKLAIQDFELRQQLSQEARSFVEKFHDVENVTTQVIELYQSVIKEPQKKIMGSKDIPYLLQITKNIDSTVRARAQIPKLKQKILELEKELRDHKVNKGPNQVEDLKHITIELKNALAKKVSEVNNANKKVVNFKSNIIELKNVLSKKNSEIKKANKQIANLTQKIEDLTKNLSEIKLKYKGLEKVLINQKIFLADCEND